MPVISHATQRALRNPTSSSLPTLLPSGYQLCAMKVYLFFIIICRLNQNAVDEFWCFLRDLHCTHIYIYIYVILLLFVTTQTKGPLYLLGDFKYISLDILFTLVIFWIMDVLRCPTFTQRKWRTSVLHLNFISEGRLCFLLHYIHLKAI